MKKICPSNNLFCFCCFFSFKCFRSQRKGGSTSAETGALYYGPSGLRTGRAELWSALSAFSQTCFQCKLDFDRVAPVTSPVHNILFIGALKSQRLSGLGISGFLPSFLTDDLVLVTPSQQDSPPECEVAWVSICSSKPNPMVLNWKKRWLVLFRLEESSCLKWRRSSNLGSCLQVREECSSKLIDILVWLLFHCGCCICVLS